jgi:hypothetical protein
LFCLPCAKEWDQRELDRAQRELDRRNQQTLSSLYKDNQITEIFTIPRVRSWHPEAVTTEFESEEEYIGDLIFTNKAVIYARLAKLELYKNSSTAFLVAEFGEVAWGSFANKRNRAQREKLLLSLPTRGLRTLHEFLKNTSSFLVFPKDKINTIKYVTSFGNSTLDISYSNQERYRFGFEDEREETYLKFKSKIESYNSYLETDEAKKHINPQEKIRAVVTGCLDGQTSLNRILLTEKQVVFYTKGVGFLESTSKASPISLNYDQIISFQVKKGWISLGEISISTKDKNFKFQNVEHDNVNLILDLKQKFFS